MSPIRSSPLPATGSRRAVRQVWVYLVVHSQELSAGAAACRTGLPQRCSPGHQPPMRPCAPCVPRDIMIMIRMHTVHRESREQRAQPSLRRNLRNETINDSRD
jgi:hypothetical protein